MAPLAILAQTSNGLYPFLVSSLCLSLPHTLLVYHDDEGAKACPLTEFAAFAEEHRDLVHLAHAVREEELGTMSWLLLLIIYRVFTSTSHMGVPQRRFFAPPPSLQVKLLVSIVLDLHSLAQRLQRLDKEGR